MPRRRGIRRGLLIVRAFNTNIGLTLEASSFAKATAWLQVLGRVAMLIPGLNTIRQALQLLVDDGLVETRQGVGTFVLRTEPVPRTIDVLAELRAHGQRSIAPSLPSRGARKRDDPAAGRGKSRLASWLTGRVD